MFNWLYDIGYLYREMQLAAMRWHHSRGNLHLERKKRRIGKNTRQYTASY